MRLVFFMADRLTHTSEAIMLFLWRQAIISDALNVNLQMHDSVNVAIIKHCFDMSDYILIVSDEQIVSLTKCLQINI